MKRNKLSKHADSQAFRSLSPADDSLLADLSRLIEQSRRSVVTYVNNAVTMLFWQVGGRINSHILRYKRAAYGEQIVVSLSRRLSWKYGFTIAGACELLKKRMLLQ